MTLGSWLREKRTARGLSVRKLAQQSGIAHPTLSRWENETHLPRIPELEAALNALKVSPTDRRHALTLLERPRALEPLRQQTLSAEPHACPVGGDLLRAMRLRQRWTQTRTAQSVGVPLHTLLRWERSESWPDTAMLHRLCFVLNAHEAELTALTCGRFRLEWPGREALSMEALQARLEGTRWPDSPPCIDLHFLTLETALLPQAEQNLKARQLLARVYVDYAAYLDEEERPEEMLRYARRALKMAEKEPSLTGAALTSVILLARAQRRHNVPEEIPACLRLLGRWLPQAVPTSHAAWYLMEIATYLSQIGQAESAWNFCTQVHRLPGLDGLPRVNSPETRLYTAGILLRIGRPKQALEALPLPSYYYRNMPMREALLLADIHLALQQPQEASVWLARARTEITQRPFARRLSKAAELSARLEGLGVSSTLPAL